MDTHQLIARLDELNAVSSQLDIDQPQREELLQKVATYAHTFINGLPTVKAFTQKEPASLSINNNAHSLDLLLRVYQTEVAETGINAASGTHLGYIPGGGIYAAALADYIAAVTNPFAGVYFASPGAATIENEVIHWMKQVFSFPENSVGNLTSGGSISTLIAFTAARDHHAIKNEKLPRSVVYLTEQVHHSTQKALRIIGLEDVQLRFVPMDAHHCMDAQSLKALIETDKANGLHPFMLVATAGTTDTGAVDPLDALATIAQQFQLWYHVDGAYGGFFVLSSKKHLFKGIERADSIIVDPHKSLFLPYGLGAVLIKDKSAALHSHQYAANYMQDAADDALLQSPSNLSPELTKHFRGLRLWLPLQLHGIAPFEACLEEKLLLVQYFRNQLQAMGFCVGPQPQLSVSYFWYPFAQDADEKNRQLMGAIHKDGAVFLSSSVINNRYVIRIAILAFRTKRQTVDKALAMIERCLQSVL